MHEGHFTDQIVAAILAELKDRPKGKVRSVKVKVGEVYHLVPASVLMHFQVAVKGTPLEGVELVLQEEGVKVYCPQCRKEGLAEDHHMIVCPICYSQNVKTLSGNSVTIESIELEPA